jgi:hypothetical protein
MLLLGVKVTFGSVTPLDPPGRKIRTMWLNSPVLIEESSNAKLMLVLDANFAAVRMHGPLTEAAHPF